MESFLTTSNIVFILGVLGTLFAIFSYFRNPQIQTEKELIKAKAKTESEDQLVTQRLQYLNETNERRFCDIQKNFEGLLLQSNNHIHTIDTKVESLSANIILMGKEIIKLSTIIEERIPQK